MSVLSRKRLIGTSPSTVWRRERRTRSASVTLTFSVIFEPKILEGFFELIAQAFWKLFGIATYSACFQGFLCDVVRSSFLDKNEASSSFATSRVKIFSFFMELLDQAYQARRSEIPHFVRRQP